MGLPAARLNSMSKTLATRVVTRVVTLSELDGNLNWQAEPEFVSLTLKGYLGAMVAQFPYQVPGRRHQNRGQLALIKGDPIDRHPRKPHE
jgi:hypothetical protein